MEVCCGTILLLHSMNIELMNWAGLLRSIAYRSAGHRSGGAGLRAATGTACFFCCLCSIVSVWRGRVCGRIVLHVWSGLCLCLCSMPVFYSAVSAWIALSSIVRRRRVSTRLAFLLSSGSWEESATKSESGFVRITSAHFAKVDEVGILKKVDERAVGRER